METTIKIDIDEYLSESEKKEYAIEAFKEAIKKELFKSSSGTIQSDSEAQRIIGNISHEIVFEEVQKFIPDFRDKIKEKVKEIILNDSLSYQVFRKKDVWEKDESLAVKYMREAIDSEKRAFQERVKSEMRNFDLSEDISNQVSEFFDSIAGNMYALSELFSKPKN